MFAYCYASWDSPQTHMCAKDNEMLHMLFSHLVGLCKVNVPYSNPNKYICHPNTMITIDKLSYKLVNSLLSIICVPGSEAGLRLNVELE